MNIGRHLWNSDKHLKNQVAELMAFRQQGSTVDRTVIEKLYESVSIKDFGAVGDGVTDDTAAIQTAITMAQLGGKKLFLNAGVYKITSILNITGNLVVFGDGQGDVNTCIQSYAPGSAIKCSAWGGKIKGITIYINNSTGNGIEIGNGSRNCAIEDVYAQVKSAYMATATGSGIYLNTVDDTNIGSFSGGLMISNSYVLGFKYGVRFRGIQPIGENTWTTVSMYNVWACGNSAGIISGSAGVYMDAGSNGIGTCLYGGTIEGFEYGVYIEDGSYGGVFESDFEGNINVYHVGNSFVGRIRSAFGTPYIKQAISSGYAWYTEKCDQGGAPIYESYYSPKYVLTSFNEPEAGNVAFTTYHNASLIRGNPVETYGKKFEIGIGLGGSYGAETHPSHHYIRLGNNKIHWGDNPSGRTGLQLVAWAQGDICYNLSAAVGQPAGWICTEAGTPGIWKSFGTISD